MSCGALSAELLALIHPRGQSPSLTIVPTSSSVPLCFFVSVLVCLFLSLVAFRCCPLFTLSNPPSLSTIPVIFLIFFLPSFSSFCVPVALDLLSSFLRLSGCPRSASLPLYYPGSCEHRCVAVPNRIAKRVVDLRL